MSEEQTQEPQLDPPKEEPKEEPKTEQEEHKEEPKGEQVEEPKEQPKGEPNPQVSIMPIASAAQAKKKCLFFSFLITSFILFLSFSQTLFL